MQEITAQEAASLLEQNPDSMVLLDVREQVELDMASVNAVTHIPMGEIPARLGELDSSKTIICMCHLGGRSAQVGAFLEANGFGQVINMAGGIDAWSQNVDPEVPRY